MKPTNKPKSKTMNNTSAKFIRIILIAILSGSFLISGSILVSGQNRQQNREQNRKHRSQNQPGGNSNAGLTVICSFSDFATIAERIAGNHANVQFIAHGAQDPHFVPPKPSYAMMLRDADLWITTGMDLETWSTTLLDKARNKQIMDGEIGFVSVSDGVNILQKVEKADRTEGDVHLMGNPHINTGPMNWKVIATNITTGLIKVDPANSLDYQSNLKTFNDQVDRALFGDELVEIFGGEMLSRLLANKTLFTFLDNDYQGEKLSGKLGGWLKQMEPILSLSMQSQDVNYS